MDAGSSTGTVPGRSCSIEFADFSAFIGFFTAI